MDRAPRAASPSWGYDLRQTLGGSFTARARGLLATGFALLDSEEEEFGRLHLSGVPSVELGSGSSVVAFEASGRRYRMVVNLREGLAADPKGQSIDKLEISCGAQNYEARVSFLCNLAVPYRVPGGERAARLSGGLTGRSYETLFTAEDGCALPVAVFLLWHVAANRRRAYRVGSPANGGAM